MGLPGANLTNPLEFNPQTDRINVPNPLEALPNFGVDLTNPMDSGIAKQLSSPMAAVENFGQVKNNVMDQFGTLTLDAGIANPAKPAERAGTTGDARTDRQAQAGADGQPQGKYNPNELSLTIEERLSTGNDRTNVLAMFAMQFLKAMKISQGDRLMPDTTGDTPEDQKMAAEFRARRVAGPSGMIRNANVPSMRRGADRPPAPPEEARTDAKTVEK